MDAKRTQHFIVITKKTIALFYSHYRSALSQKELWQINKEQVGLQIVTRGQTHFRLASNFLHLTRSRLTC